MSRIIARATVDELRPKFWEVTVEGGVQMGDYRRVYDIFGKSDTLAAQEGIRRFVEEVGNLVDDYCRSTE